MNIYSDLFQKTCVFKRLATSKHDVPDKRIISLEEVCFDDRLQIEPGERRESRRCI